MLELEKLMRRVNELEHMGDIDLMQQYVTDTRAIHKRIGEAQEQITFINKVSGGVGAYSLAF